MSEDFLYFIWENKLFSSPNLETPDLRSIRLIHPGYRNDDAGPDYLYSKLVIDGQYWVGQVEMHVKSSDWNRHGHQHDPNYNAVILHVVWEHDKDIFIHSPGDLPVLILSKFAIADYERGYQKLSQNLALFPCESQIKQLPNLLKRQWLDRLLVDRMHLISERVLRTFQNTGNDWQECFYLYLVRSFGLRVNAEAFEMLGKSISYQFVSRFRDREHALEAVFFGQSGMLSRRFTDPYPVKLQKEYEFWRRMFGFDGLDQSVFRYHRMHPSAFPSIRIAQLAALLRDIYPISDLIQVGITLAELKSKLTATPHQYWNTHYKFDSPVKMKSSLLGEGTIERIILHSVIPILFTMGKVNSKQSYIENALSLLEELRAEENKITKKWTAIGVHPENAADTQALIHSFKQCCSAKKCLSCLIGKQILVRTKKHDSKDV